jgi:metal-responsive CopG/Arc/MetJ family transcriptional regulator
MRNAVTISLPVALAKEVDSAAKRKGQTRSQFIQESLQRDLFREELMEARKTLGPAARRAGLYTDEDIFKAFS